MAMLKNQRVHDKWYTKGIAAASRLWPGNIGWQQHTDRIRPLPCRHSVPWGWKRSSWNRQLVRLQPDMFGGWTINDWLVVWNMNFIFHISIHFIYMGCHPSHRLSYYSRLLKPPTRRVWSRRNCLSPFEDFCELSALKWSKEWYPDFNKPHLSFSKIASGPSGRLRAAIC